MSKSFNISWLDGIYLYALPPVTLAVVSLYIFSLFIASPYLGFELETSSGTVTRVYHHLNSDPLKVHDQILTYDGEDWQAYFSQNHRPGPLFKGTRLGDRLNFVVLRGTEQVPVHRTLSPPTRAELIHRSQEIWWLGLLFWITGTIVVIFIRPIDTRWRLLVVYNYFNSIWILAGLSSGMNYFRASQVLHAALIIGLPLSFHLYWHIPNSLGKLGHWIWGFYALGIIAASLEWAGLLPGITYVITALISAGLILTMMLVRIFVIRNNRRSALFLTVMFLASFSIPSLYGISEVNGSDLLFGSLPLITLIGIPLSQMYVISRKRLGKFEIRANRLIVFFLLFILISIIFISIVLIFNDFLINLEKVSIISLFVFSTIFLFTLGNLIYGPFERFIDYYLLGIQYSGNILLYKYSERITTSQDHQSLINLITGDLLPSLLIRQSAILLKNEQGSWKRLFAFQINNVNLPSSNEIESILQLHDRYLPEGKNLLPQHLSWIRLALPIRVTNKLVGVWLQGRRDPDDFYSLKEIDILKLIANHTGIALQNISQSDRMRQLYHANINRHEAERQQMALELHDNILNQIAAMRMSYSQGDSPHHIQAAYQVLADQVREMIQDLRPALLNFGLGIALEELYDQIREKNSGRENIKFAVRYDNSRYPVDVELHVYRIIQQACENALRHAQASCLYISGALTEAEITLQVKDDGIGISEDLSQDFTQLLNQQKYGLVGIHERAAIIDADIKVSSALNEGVTIALHWSPPYQD